jgi:H/ACA ribonucleoprotein complex non-core subunit NAF1
MPSYQNSPPQAAGPQTYQFNGYTFQYGSGPPQPQAHSGFYGQSPQASSSATAIPPGAYVNPAFFPNQANQQFRQQWPPQQHQPAYGAAQNQQYQNAQPGAAPSPQQQNNLADILRQFGGGRQQ